jgi:hypothetical protein
MAHDREADDEWLDPASDVEEPILGDRSTEGGIGRPLWRADNAPGTVP